jgi:hypothetical protein
MKTLLIQTIFAFFILFSLIPAFSEPLDELIPQNRKELLLAQNPITEVAEKASEPALLPRNENVRNITSAIIKELSPSMLTESLYLYEKPADSPWTLKEKNDLYNETLALSTLEGLQYYSASRKTMRTFYETSRVIDNPSSKKPVQDPRYNDPPASLTIYAKQKDLTFGDNIYQYDYYVYGDALVFVQQNLTSLTAGIIPAVGKNKLRSAVAVIDAGKYLLVYAASFAKTVSLPGMKDRIGQSFSNRATAILGWFSQQADKAFSP